jgi:hypothetical protein
MSIDRRDSQRAEALGGVDVTDDQVRQASLTICDPLYGLSKEEAVEVLKALGLKHDSKHVELASFYGSKRRA